MEKYEFIKLMLNNRHLSINEKRRLLVLATQEIDQKKTVVKDTDKGGKGDTIKNGHRSGIEDKYVSPTILHDFLKRYNQDDILKYTCHIIDYEEDINLIIKECDSEHYDLKKHSKLIEKRFTNLLENYKKEYPLILKSKMIPLMRGYITGKNYSGETVDWSSLHIKMNWQHNDLLDWGARNQGIIPCPGLNIASKQKNNGFKLTERFISYLSGKLIRNMNDLVLFFKSLHHIKQDNSLRNILDYYNNTNEDIKTLIDNEKIKIIYSNFADNIELFTDVDKLLQAYNRIIKLCVENHNKKFGETANIELNFYEDDKYTYFCIHHKNNTYGKTVKNAIDRIGKQQRNLIINQVNGLCDLFIEADFGGNSFNRINLWDENPEMTSVKIEEMKGVKYIMRF